MAQPNNMIQMNVHTYDMHARMVELRLQMEKLDPKAVGYEERKNEILAEVDKIEEEAMADFGKLKKRILSMADFIQRKKHPVQYWFWYSLIWVKQYGWKLLKLILGYAIILGGGTVIAKQIFKLLAIIWNYA